MRIPLTLPLRNTWGVAVACGSLELLWLEQEKVEDKCVLTADSNTGGGAAGPLQERIQGGAFLVTVEFKSPERGWIRPLSENEHSPES